MKITRSYNHSYNYSSSLETGKTCSTDLGHDTSEIRTVCSSTSALDGTCAYGGCCDFAKVAGNGPSNQGDKGRAMEAAAGRWWEKQTQSTFLQEDAELQEALEGPFGQVFDLYKHWDLESRVNLVKHYHFGYKHQQEQEKLDEEVTDHEALEKEAALQLGAEQYEYADQDVSTFDWKRAGGAAVSAKGGFFSCFLVSKDALSFGDVSPCTTAIFEIYKSFRFASKQGSGLNGMNNLQGNTQCDSYGNPWPTEESKLCHETMRHVAAQSGNGVNDRKNSSAVKIIGWVYSLILNGVKCLNCFIRYSGFYRAAAGWKWVAKIWGNNNKYALGAQGSSGYYDPGKGHSSPLARIGGDNMKFLGQEWMTGSAYFLKAVLKILGIVTWLVKTVDNLICFFDNTCCAKFGN